MVDFEEFRQTVEGQVCLDLVAQECWYRGELVESLNVLYLRFAETGWARLGIDAGDFHWREDAAAERIQSTEPEFDYPLRNLAPEFPVIGQRIQAATIARFDPLHVVLRIVFDTGAAIELTDLNDRTHIQFRAGAV